MSEVVPGVAVIAVVLADRSPLPLAEVGSPFLPGDLLLARVVQPFLLSNINNHSVHVWPHYLVTFCNQGFHRRVPVASEGLTLVKLRLFAKAKRTGAFASPAMILLQVTIEDR